MAANVCERAPTMAPVYESAVLALLLAVLPELLVLAVTPILDDGRFSVVTGVGACRAGTRAGAGRVAGALRA
ncbi:hypothetical protein NL387_26890, partial [Klebsiella pneumoniae]|nr:hypothetical protein [Klebsiella pneumoniae]